MKTFKNLLFVMLCSVALSGCAIYGGSSYGQKAATYATVGAIAGAAIPSAVGNNNPAVAVLSATLGGVVGSLIGEGVDERNAALGWTECSTSYSGTVGVDGKPVPSEGTYGCGWRGGFRGHANTPPPAQRGW